MDRDIAALLAKPLWHAERKALRDILLGCGLTETVKWGNLCYTDAGANIVMIYALKAYCGLSFFKGSLMNDPEKLLYQRSEQMQAARLRFTGFPAISRARGQISAFVADAVAIEKAGLRVEMTVKDALVYPPELQDRIDEDAGFAQAFVALTPGRKRGYVLHIARAKQSATRLARIDKNTQRIFAGKGIFDCVCGLSKRMPRCDGSHKALE